MARLILFNKPHGVLSQFTDHRSPTPRATLSDHVDMPGVYPAGRLDRDSEGLLLLTDDGRLQNRIASPRSKSRKPISCKSRACRMRPRSTRCGRA